MSKPGKVKWRDYPVGVALWFRTAKEREWFMGQLCDGFGENFCNMDWDGKGSIRSAHQVAVELADESKRAMAGVEERRRARLAAPADKRGT